MAGPGGGAGRAGQEAKSRGEKSRAGGGGGSRDSALYGAEKFSGFTQKPDGSWSPTKGREWQGSRGTNQGRPVRPLDTNYQVPEKPLEDFEVPSIMGGVAGLADEIMNGSNYSGVTGWKTDPISDNGGKDSAAEWFNTVGQPQQAPAAAPAPTAPTMTLDDYLTQIKSNFVDPNSRYYLEQRGLVDPTSPAGIPEEWQPTFNRQYDFIKSTLPQDIYDPKAKEADTYNKLRTYFTDQFGDTALGNEQTRRRNEYSTALKGKGFENQISGSFGDTADDALIESIINPQYQAAQDIIGNQQKRGTLTPSGYNYALGKLGEQRTSGVNTLQGIGATERSKLGGGVEDYLSSLYGQAGEYELGGSFDPDSFDAEFGNRLSSASGSLEGNIRAASPTNLFDTGTTLQEAGGVQGQTSRGGLLDTLSSRRRGNSRQRGLGTTGQF